MMESLARPSFTRQDLLAALAVFFAALVFRLGYANLYLNELPDAALVNRE